MTCRVCSIGRTRFFSGARSERRTVLTPPRTFGPTLPLEEEGGALRVRPGSGFAATVRPPSSCYSGAFARTRNLGPDESRQPRLILPSLSGLSGWGHAVTPGHLHGPARDCGRMAWIVGLNPTMTHLVFLDSGRFTRLGVPGFCCVSPGTTRRRACGQPGTAAHAPTRRGRKMQWSPASAAARRRSASVSMPTSAELATPNFSIAGTRLATVCAAKP